jgi:anti-sigma B factor antagonist
MVAQIQIQAGRTISVSAKLTTRQVDEVTVIDVSGRITLGEGTSMLRDELRNLISTNRRKILLNLAEISYIDSSAIGQMVAGFTTVANQGGQLKLVNPTKRMSDLLQVTKVSTIFEIFDDEKKAVATFK